MNVYTAARLSLSNFVITIKSLIQFEIKEKKKSGPKRVFPLDQLIKYFEENEADIVLAPGKILPPSDKFWMRLKNKYKINKTEKSIYTDALKWHKKCESEKNEEIPTEKIDDFDDLLEDEIEFNSADSSEYESETSDDSSGCAKSDIQFSMKITYNTWKLILPTSRSYHRKADKTHKGGVRKYLVLKPGFWSNVFAEKIAQHPKNIICDWAFKKARVSGDSKHYVVITASCINCKSKLCAVLEKKPQENEEVKFTCVVKNFNEKRHEESTKKVKVSGSQAKSLAVSKKPAIVLHRNLAAKSGEMFKQAKGRVPTANAIRNLQSRHRAKEKLSPEIFTSLLYLQTSKKYVDTIHSIGMSPFFVIYGSNNQFRLYNMYIRKNKLTRMSCDATGSVVKKIGM